MHGLTPLNLGSPNLPSFCLSTVVVTRVACMKQAHLLKPHLIASSCYLLSLILPCLAQHRTVLLYFSIICPKIPLLCTVLPDAVFTSLYYYGHAQKGGIEEEKRKKNCFTFFRLFSRKDIGVEFNAWTGFRRIVETESILCKFQTCHYFKVKLPLLAKVKGIPVVILSKFV